METLRAFVFAYARFFAKKGRHLLAWGGQTQSKLAALLYRQRGRLAQPAVHFFLGLFLVLGINFAPLVENQLQAQSQQWSTFVPSSPFVSFWGAQLVTTTQTANTPRGEIIEYTVRPGDTLSGLAEKFGVSQETIVWANKLGKKEKLRAGQRLLIPPVSGVIHKVRRGETVWSIAKKYGVSPQAIVDFPFNTFKDDETFALSVGQILVVPGGVMPKVAPRPKAPPPQVVAGAGKGMFIWPTTGYITQRYFWYHRAVDIANPKAPPVVAAAGGRVILVVRSRVGYGNHVVIDHGNGWRTLYAHLSQIWVSPNQKVSAGTPLGRMGATGRATGIHLHFEIIKNGVKLNPLSLLR